MEGSATGRGPLPLVVALPFVSPLLPFTKEHGKETAVLQEDRDNNAQPSMILCFLILLHVITLVAGNTEKVIFKGPAQVHVPDVTPNLGNLKLQQLSPSSNVVRTQLQRAFPTKLESKGTQSWFLLDGLDHGVRYEVRICWAAIVCEIGQSSCIYMLRLTACLPIHNETLSVLPLTAFSNPPSSGSKLTRSTTCSRTLN